MSSTTEVIVTKDGSHSLLNVAMNETYHSVHGALQESRHVFIRHGLLDYLGLNKSDEVTVLEIGFGTGLNALLTLEQSLLRKQKIQYTSLEAFPLSKETWTALNYTESIGFGDQFSSFHEGAWSTDLLYDTFILRKEKVTVQEYEVKVENFDLVYFDAFAPAKQPEMWELPVLEKVTRGLKKGGIFVTYCARGQLKRDLRDLGLQVETLPGPPGKKEMVRAFKH